jgi:hypothetical protein
MKARALGRLVFVVAVLALAAVPVCAGSLIMAEGLDFTGSTLYTNSNSIPPDTMGAVGPNHIVELINGRYSVYNKTTGANVQTSTLDQFWTNAGASWTSRTYDPRVVYDPFSQRFFACAADNPRAANNLLLAVSNSSDPTAGWTGFAIDSDSDDTHWCDFPMLGFDNNGVYVSANMYDVPTSTTAAVTVWAIPKSDLTGGSPTVANRTTWSELNANNTGYSMQPALDMDNSGSANRFFSSYNTGSGYSKRSDITWSGGTPTLDARAAWDQVYAFGNYPTGYSEPPDAGQPGSTDPDIETNDSRVCSNVVLINGTMWATHTVEHPTTGHAAIHWMQVNEYHTTGSAPGQYVLQDGLISDPNLDFYFASIAVNADDVVVIGFTGSDDTTQYASSYAVLGETVGATTTFGTPMLLHAGTHEYFEDFGTGKNRWGDYSATVVDPSDPYTFWTFQEWCSADDVWSTRITELTVTPEPTTLAVVAAGMGLAAAWRRRRRKR